MAIITQSKYNTLVNYLFSMGFHSLLYYDDEISEETCQNTINGILNLLDVTVVENE